MRMKTIGLVFALACALSGCKATECEQMLECCAASEGAPGVGKWCGEFTQQTRDPDTCRSVLRTLEMMYEDRKKELPPVCKVR